MAGKLLVLPLAAAAGAGAGAGAGDDEPPATTSTSMHDVYNSRYVGSTAVSFVKSHTQYKA